jgi:hypothetical protein
MLNTLASIFRPKEERSCPQLPCIIGWRTRMEGENDKWARAPPLPWSANSTGRPSQQSLRRPSPPPWPHRAEDVKGRTQQRWHGHCCLPGNHYCVGLTPTGVQRPETRSLARLISRPDRGRQPTDGCGPPSRCAQLKGGEGLGDEDDWVHWNPKPSPTSL